MSDNRKMDVSGRLRAIDVTLNSQMRMMDNFECKATKINDRLDRLEQRHVVKKKSVNSTKKRIPLFRGKNDDDVYLKWEKKVEKKFACHNYSEENKIRIASFSFSDDAVRWWDRLEKTRRLFGDDPIATWDEMKTTMRKRFAPSYSSYMQVEEGVISLSQKEVFGDHSGLIIASNEDLGSEGVEKSNEKLRDIRESKLQKQSEQERKEVVEDNEDRIFEGQEAEKENIHYYGPRKSENQSEKKTWVDEEEKDGTRGNSLIFTHSNPYLSCGEFSFLQEHEDVFFDEIPKDMSSFRGIEDHIDFVFGDRKYFNEPNKLRHPTYFKGENSINWEYNKMTKFTALNENICSKLMPYLQATSDSHVFGCDSFNMGFGVILLQGQLVDFPHWQQIERWKNIMFEPNEFVLKRAKGEKSPKHWNNMLGAKKDSPIQEPRRLRFDAYKISLQGEYNESDIFKILNPSFFFYMVLDSRMNLFEERGNDTCMEGTSGVFERN